MTFAVLALVVLVAVATLLPYLRREAWWIRILDFPRVQVLILALAAFVFCAIGFDSSSYEKPLLLTVMLAAIIVQATCIFPYTPLAPKEVLPAGAGEPQQPRPGVSLLVANVLMTNRHSDRLLQSIEAHSPDLVLLLEPDEWWEERMRVLEQQGYAYALKEPRDNKYGMLLLSRLELLSPEVRHLLKPDIPSMHTKVRLHCGACIWLHCVHPEPPSPTEADSSLPRDAELLIVGREAKEHGLPTIVAGDLNDVAWSHTTRLFQKMTSLLDPRKGRGMFNSYHAKIPFLRWPLDHVFHSDHFVLSDLKRLPDFGSDHFPVFLSLVLRPELAPYQQAPEPDQEDKKDASEKVDKAKE